MVKRIIYAILALVCLLYSVVVYMVGSGTFSFVIWIAIGLFFAFLLFMDINNKWSKVPRVFRYLFRSCIAICLVIFLVCQGCILNQFFSKGEKDLDYIIVLGAQMRDWGPSVVYKYRLDAAVEYLNDNPETKVVVTGGQGANESISEGEGGKAYLLEQGISEDRIIVENTSVDTEANIKNALDIIDGYDSSLKIGIVTNNFHLFRGEFIADRLTEAEISGIAAFTEYQFLPNNMVRETFGILKDLI